MHACGLAGSTGPWCTVSLGMSGLLSYAACMQRAGPAAEVACARLCAGVGGDGWCLSQYLQCVDGPALGMCCIALFDVDSVDLPSFG
jgi:hypothetical protein